MSLTRAILEAPAELAEELQRALVAVGNEHTIRVKTRQFGPWRDQSYADKLRTRGGTINRVRSDLPRKGTPLGALRLTQIVSGPNVHMQELGGRANAKAGSGLKIPLKAAQTAAGRLKSDAAFTKRGTGPRGGDVWRNDKGERSFIVRTKQNNRIVAVKRGKRLVPMFVLKEFVELPSPGRLKFVETWTGMQDFTTAQVERAAVTALKRVAARMGNA